MLLTVDVLGLKVDVFVVDFLKVDVLEVVQMGRPEKKHINIQGRESSWVRGEKILVSYIFEQVPIII